MSLDKEITQINLWPELSEVSKPLSCYLDCRQLPAEDRVVSFCLTDANLCSEAESTGFSKISAFE